MMTIIHTLTFKKISLAVVFSLLFGAAGLAAASVDVELPVSNTENIALQLPSWENIEVQSDSFYNQMLRVKKIKKIAITGSISSLVALALCYYFYKQKNGDNNGEVEKSDEDLLSSWKDEWFRQKRQDLIDKQKWLNWITRGLKWGLFTGTAASIAGSMQGIYSGSVFFVKNIIQNFLESGNLRETFYFFRDTIFLNLKWISDLLVDLESNQIKGQINSNLYDYYKRYLVQSANALIESFESFSAVLLAKSKHVFGEYTVENQDAIRQVSDFSLLIIDFVGVLQKDIDSLGERENYQITEEIFAYQDILKTQLLRMAFPEP